MKLFLGLCLLFFLCLETITPSLQYKITKISAEKSQKKENYPYWDNPLFLFFDVFITPLTLLIIARLYVNLPDQR